MDMPDDVNKTTINQTLKEHQLFWNDYIKQVLVVVKSIPPVSWYVNRQGAIEMLANPLTTIPDQQLYQEVLDLINEIENPPDNDDPNNHLQININKYL